MGWGWGVCDGLFGVWRGLWGCVGGCRVFISGWGGQRVTAARGGGNSGGPSPGRRRVRGFLRAGGAALEGEVKEEWLEGAGVASSGVYLHVGAAPEGCRVFQNKENHQ